MNGKLTATLSARGRLKATLSKAIERVEPIIKPIEIAENGEYSAPEGVHGFNPVNVNVPLKYEEGYTDGYQASQDSITLQEKTITENGEYETDEGFTGMSKVTVAVPIKEEQTKTVNTNVAFEGDIGKPYIDTSKITDFYLFAQRNRLNDLVCDFDTSNGLVFDYMFSRSNLLTSVPELDTSNGTTFEYMFSECSKLKKVSYIDVSKGTTFDHMFSECSKLESLPPLDISSGTFFGSMFTYCGMLDNLILTTPKKDLSSNSFYGCTALKNITIGEGWAVNIYLHYSNNLTVESLHGMIENLADLTGKTAKTFQIGATNLAKVDEEHINMLKAKNWNYS